MSINAVMVTILVLNVGVALCKLAVGYKHSSMSLVADGYHSFMDGLSNVVGLIAVTLSRQPPDAEHPYGHRKFETLASMVVATLILGTAFEVVRGVRERLAVGGLPDASALTFATAIGTLAVNLFVAFWERAQARRLNSDFLAADAQHTMSDIYVTLGVLTSLVLARMGYGQADTVVSLGVGLFIGWIGLRLLMAPTQVLLDAAAIPVAEVVALVSAIPEIAGCHAVRSRGRPDDVYMELHIQVDPEVSVREGHRRAHVVKARLMEHWPQIRDVVIHVEPDEPHRRHEKPSGPSTTARHSQD